MQFKSEGYKQAIIAFVTGEHAQDARVANICIEIMKDPDASILVPKSGMLKEQYIQGVIKDTMAQGKAISRSRVRQTWAKVVVPSLKYNEKENQFIWNYEKILETAKGVKAGKIKVEAEYKRPEQRKAAGSKRETTAVDVLDLLKKLSKAERKKFDKAYATL